MKKIVIPTTQSDNLTAQLKCLYQTFKQFKFGEQVEFDLSNLQWACPMLVLPLAAYIQESGSTYKNSKIESYLSNMHFPGGVQSIPEWQMEKNFIPIGFLQREDIIQNEKLTSCFTEMIYKIFERTKGIKDAVDYPLTELVANIFEHSKSASGYVFAQFYPKKKYLDICIVDTGRGLAKSYNEEVGFGLSDEQAIRKALEGFSTKPNRHERGYGLNTSKKLICQGLGGGFVLLSGSAVFISSGKKEMIAQLNNFYWQGVIIAYRMPKPEQPIDIHEFIT